MVGQVYAEIKKERVVQSAWSRVFGSAIQVFDCLLVFDVRRKEMGKGFLLMSSRFIFSFYAM